MDFKRGRGERDSDLQDMIGRLRHGAGTVEDLEFALATLGSASAITAIRGIARVTGRTPDRAAARRRDEIGAALLHHAELKYDRVYGTISMAPRLIAMADIMHGRGFFGTLDLASADKTRDGAIAGFLGMVTAVSKEGIMARGNDRTGLPPHVTEVIFGLRQFVDDREEVKDGSYYPHRDPRVWEWLGQPDGLAERQASLNRQMYERSIRQPIYDTWYGDVLVRPASLPDRFNEGLATDPPDLDMVGTMFAAASQYVNYRESTRPDGPITRIATDPRISDLLEDYVADGLPLLVDSQPPLWLAQLAVDQLRDARRKPKHRKTTPIFTDRGAPTEEDLARVAIAVGHGVEACLGPGASGYRRNTDEFLLAAEYWLRRIAANNYLLGDRSKGALNDLSDKRIRRLFSDGLVDKKRASSRFQLPLWIEADLERLRGR